jgi:DNA-binding transcriptional MocR family regulator
MTLPSQPIRAQADGGGHVGLSTSGRSTPAPCHRLRWARVAQVGQDLLSVAPESLGMKALEVPASPRDGISLDALEVALEREKVRACVALPNFHNPLGSVMPDEAKARLVEMLARRDIPLIEDDVYGEVYFGARRPPVCKRWDRTGNVILCSSFSKILAPGFRVGWIAGGRYSERIAALRFINSSATPPLTQAVIAAFMRDGGYDRHLRSLRAAFAIQVANVARSVRRHFPQECRFSVPQGGLVLWVELPRGTNARELFHRALGQSISIAPGCMFTTSRRFDHYVRLNCGYPWSPAIDAALGRLGKLVSAMAKS